MRTSPYFRVSVGYSVDPAINVPSLIRPHGGVSFRLIRQIIVLTSGNNVNELETAAAGRPTFSPHPFNHVAHLSYEGGILIWYPETFGMFDFFHLPTILYPKLCKIVSRIRFICQSSVWLAFFWRLIGALMAFFSRLINVAYWVLFWYLLAFYLQSANRMPKEQIDVLLAFGLILS